MADAQRYQPGDRVIHPSRPEWGQGVVLKASMVRHADGQAQKLLIDFTHRKRVTINTAVATLALKDSSIMTLSATNSSAGGWLAQLEGNVNGHDVEQLYQLPDALTDPFNSETNRLHATLHNYRFSTEPRALLDWAVAQTGLDDPLSHFTRHDLEQAFARFSRNRDLHLKELVLTIKKMADGRQILRDAAGKPLSPDADFALKNALKA